MTDETTAAEPAPDAWGDTAAFQEASPAVESDSMRAYDPVGQSDLTDEHPEAIVGAALAGGFLFAKILKRLGS